MPREKEIIIAAKYRQFLYDYKMYIGSNSILVPVEERALVLYSKYNKRYQNDLFDLSSRGPSRPLLLLEES
jgi:hypothetical protein